MSAADTKKLLDAIFGSAPTAWLVRGHHDAAEKLHIRQEGHGSAILRDADDAYFCIAELKPGATSRAIGNALGVRVLVIDDVGDTIPREGMEMLCPLEPHFTIETSAGSEHWGFIMDLMPVEEYDALREAMETHPVYGGSHGADAVHIFRAPFGTNTKASRNGFKPKLIKDNLGAKPYTHAEIRKLAWTAIGAPRPKAPAGAGGERMIVDIESLKALLALVPNEPHHNRHYWQSVGHYTYGAFGSGGFEAFDEWSTPHGSYNAAKTQLFWDTIKPSQVLSRGGKLRELAEQADPEGFVAWKNKWDAPRVFDDISQVRDATAFSLPDPKTFPRRPWLYGGRVMRGYVSATIAPGGMGKSSLVMTESIAMASGKDLLGHKTRAPLRIWMWNGEDDQTELGRRITAACMHFGIGAGDLGDRIYLDSGRDKQIVIAAANGKGTVLNDKGIETIKKIIRERKIDVLVLDPFVSTHRISENDNMAVDLVARALRGIAEECQCAVDIVHHVRKPGSGSNGAASTDDARGASALVNALRHARVLAPMPANVAAKLGVTNPRAYFCIQHATTKANMAPPSAGEDWYKFESVGLGNGEANPADGLAPHPEDMVGVVVRWTPPAQTLSEDPQRAAIVQREIAKGGPWRLGSGSRREAWVGTVVGEALGIDVKAPGAKKLVEDTVGAWVKKGWLKIVIGKDPSRHDQEYVEVGVVAVAEVFDDETALET